MHVSRIEAEADTRIHGRLTRRIKLSRDEGRAERRSPEGSTRSYNKDRDGKAARGFAVHARNKKQGNERNRVAVKSKYCRDSGGEGRSRTEGRSQTEGRGRQTEVAESNQPP
ncbi:hypothetical protein H6P81_003423 [Aristolochia fimbriata]|uniref:Uncharacterized protein n=1 Tax=Aristolochia fimbriata TaxID=158543 RepID=A0AAV7FCI7_ARIFI|nr:hypothetical protein H6P81_003423 [Aristolochia fimbriata]